MIKLILHLYYALERRLDKQKVVRVPTYMRVLPTRGAALLFIVSIIRSSSIIIIIVIIIVCSTYC